MKITRDSNIIIAGQHLTSRTEALRDFLLDKVHTVAVIAFGSAFIDKKENHLFFYQNGVLKKHYVYSHAYLNKIKSPPLLIIFTFLSYVIDIFRAIFVFRKKFDIFIGISHFQGLIGVIFKAMNLCKKTIYYSIDYYALPIKTSFFHRVLIKAENSVDRFAVLNSEEIWDISPRIAQARQGFGALKKQTYHTKNKIVPLGYSKNFFRNKDIRDIDRYSVVFVGVITQGQGLELLIDVLPELQKIIPSINVRIIGTGRFLQRYKTLISEWELEKLFKFYGFIENEFEMLDIISSSAVGISIWDNRMNKLLNSYFGDPGKTKLYSACGLPVIVSNDTVYSQVIACNKAGIAINYTPGELAAALNTLLTDDNDYYEYKSNAVITAGDYCDSEKILSSVLN